MKKMLAVLAVIAGLGFGYAAQAQAQEMEISVDVGVDALSGYVWRGGPIPPVGGDEALVFQPSVTFGFGESGLAFNIWGSVFAMDRSAPISTDQADEVDFTLSYDRALGQDGKVGLSLGIIEYTFPSLDAGTKHSEEFWVGLSFDHVIAPSVTFYYDFGLADDYYITAGIGPEFPLGDGDNAPTLGLGASVGFTGDSGFYGGKSGLQDVTFTASVGFMAGSISISPMVGVTIPKEEFNPDTTYWGGVSFGFSK
jgi:hypothetical protein